MFAWTSFIATACKVIFMLKTADPLIIVDGFGVLGPMPDGVTRHINDLGFFVIIQKIRFYLDLVYVTFCRGREVDWAFIDLEDLFLISNNVRWMLLT